MDRFGDGRDWFFEKRFGLFVHWGLYAIEGWQEQHLYRGRLEPREYEQLQHQFNPTGFDPDAWLDLAGEAGMEYVCFTTKHIDGFCMWDTAHTDYKITNTPYGKDALGMLAEACHRRDFPLCLYYSCVDEHHPNYPHAGRPYEYAEPRPGDEPDLGRYLDYVVAQMRELCTNYGDIHAVFWDANVVKHHDPGINDMIRELQPKAVINHRGYDDGDYGTPEREAAGAIDRRPYDRPTEACNSVGTQSWGYRKDEDYHSLRHLLECIDAVMAKGGNYLLNVGPDGLGRIPAASQTRLRQIGEWFRMAAPALRDCEPASELTDNPAVQLTRKGSTLFVHLTKPPTSDAVILNPLTEQPTHAVLLNTGAPVETSLDLLPRYWKTAERFLRIKGLPVDDFTGQVLIVQLDFDRPVQRQD